jgi:hypothetical protein
MKSMKASLKRCPEFEKAAAIELRQPNYPDKDS